MSTLIGVETVPQFTITDRLRKAREHAGMEQQDLADAMGTSRGTVSNYERGIVPPKRPYLLAWALATGVSLDWLATGATPSGDPGNKPRGVARRYVIPHRLAA